MVTINFGVKITREKPLRNPLLPEDVRKHEAEYCLYLENCGWRLETGDQVIGSSVSSNLKGGEMLIALDRILGTKVVRAEVDTPSFDLRLEFSNGLRLLVFCFGASNENLDNYTFFTRSAYYVSRFTGKLDRVVRDAES